MPEFNSGVYDLQISDPVRFVKPEDFFAKLRAYAVQPFTVDAAQNDVLNLIKLPADTMLCPSLAQLYTTALGVSVTGDVGWAANAAIGLTADPNGLADGLDLSAATVVNPFALKNTAALALKPLWEWCGLSEAPSRDTEITLTLTLADANPASGTFSAFLPVRARG